MDKGKYVNTWRDMRDVHSSIDSQFMRDLRNESQLCSISFDRPLPQHSTHGYCSNVLNESFVGGSVLEMSFVRNENEEESW